MDIGNLRMVQFRVSYSKNAAPVTLSLTADSLPENAMGITELTFTDDLIVNAKIILTRSHYERTPFHNDSTESRFVVLLRSMTRTKADSGQVTCQSLAPLARLFVYTPQAFNRFSGFLEEYPEPQT